MRGTAGTRTLSRSVIKHINKCEYPGGEIGDDFSVLGCNETDGSALISAIGFADIAGDMHKTELAFIRAIDNLVLSGATPDSVQIQINAEADCPEQSIRDEMHFISEYLKTRGVRIAGGNTHYFGEGQDYSVSITAYGRSDNEKLYKKREKIIPGDRVVVSGTAGRYGASLICHYKKEELRSRFAESYLMECLMDKAELDISQVAKHMIDAGAVYLHDVSFGGIYRTFLEIAEKSGFGIDIEHESVPIRQHTIEVCEFMNINPYLLLGTGSVAAVVHEKDLEEFEARLRECEIPYSICGVITEDKKRLIHSAKNDMRRSITLYDEDEIYKVIS